MQIETFNLITIILAITGTVLSVVALIWNIIRDLTDKGELKVEAMIATDIASGSDKPQLVITVTNVGRRPMVVKNLYGKTTTAELLLHTRYIPKVLSEKEYVLEWFGDLSKISKNLIGIYVSDSTGKEWKISRKNLKELLKDKEKLKQSN